MDATRIDPPRRLSFPIANRWGEGEMAALDFGDSNRPFDLVFVHANGFNALTYRQLLAPLSGSLRILAPDLRGHGRTRLPTPIADRRGWADHRDDLLALLDALDGPPVVMAGHSMGAVCALLAAAERPQAVARLILLDPVIWPRPLAAAFRLPLLRLAPRRLSLVAGAQRRRATFPDRATALKGYQGRGAFRGWPAGMLADYVEDGLVDQPDGTVALACAPEWEASNYASQAHDPWRALDRFEGPVEILKAEHGSPCFVPDGGARRPNLTVRTVPEAGHFFPMLQPEIARDALFEAAV